MHIPDEQKESYSLDHKVALPDRKLKLQWVYPSDRKAVLAYKTIPFFFNYSMIDWKKFFIFHRPSAATHMILLNRH